MYLIYLNNNVLRKISPESVNTTNRPTIMITATRIHTIVQVLVLENFSKVFLF